MTTQKDFLHQLIALLEKVGIPYMITGQLNEHPRSAMKFLAGDTPDDFLAFYDDILEEE